MFNTLESTICPCLQKRNRNKPSDTSTHPSIHPESGYYSHKKPTIDIQSSVQIAEYKRSDMKILCNDQFIEQWHRAVAWLTWGMVGSKFNRPHYSFTHLFTISLSKWHLTTRHTCRKIYCLDKHITSTCQNTMRRLCGELGEWDNGHLYKSQKSMNIKVTTLDQSALDPQNSSSHNQTGILPWGSINYRSTF